MNLYGLFLFADQTEEQVNITPVLLRFTGKFFAIFAIVALVTVLTPWLAKKVDAFREKHTKPALPEDPRCKAVRGPYDMPEPPAQRPRRKRRPHPPGERPHRPQGQRPDGTRPRRPRPDGMPPRRPRPAPTEPEQPHPTENS